jgi:hypothetical protein
MFKWDGQNPSAKGGQYDRFLHNIKLLEMRQGILFQINNRDIYFFFLKKLRYTEIASAMK